MNTIGIRKPLTSNGYCKTEGSYVNSNNNENIEEKKYYLNKVPEAI